MAKFTITINATLNGKTCKNPQIEFIQGSDVIYPCEISGNQITIETLPGTNPNACVEGYIKCEDECLNCPPQYFKKCLCNDVTLLEACQICKDGFIEDVCTPEETAAGKVCTPNGCQCPPDKPILDPNTGQCVQCITGTVQGCSICVAGMWTTIECPDGKVCKDGECVCPIPYVLNPLTGKCELQDECSDDADCGECQTCILGKCQPVQCPVGLQPFFVNGKCECVPECADQTCNNGADCGENCGCLDGKCVPCTVLSCLDEASCEAALGCKCNGDKCGPVDNCNQDCSDSPCLDANCTCYNGKCVNCENFPCTDEEGGCDSYYNCKCNNEGNCEGGKGCKDTLTLTKKEECSADGCQLEAVYKSDNKCMCDPILFKVKNSKTCVGGVPSINPFVTLQIEMFKGDTSYTQFKNSDKFSDDEIVSGVIKVITTSGGNSTTITKDIGADNKITDISIQKPVLGSDNKVTIKVIAEGLKVNANGCTNYDSKEIASYEFDFNQGDSAICTKLANYGTAQEVKVNDTISTKKPLIVWYRSSSEDFGTGFVDVQNPSYTAKGYFRKKYLTGVAGSFSDKITKPEEGLLNNFRYKVTVDCGCEGANTATTGDVVIFCCPKDIEIVPVEGTCGNQVILKKFNVCSVNNPLLNESFYPIPSIPNFYVLINETIKQKVNTGVIENISISHTEAIKKIEFFIEFSGSKAVVKKACSIVKNPPISLPEFIVDTSTACIDGVILVTSTSALNTISSVVAEKGTAAPFKITFTQDLNIFKSNNYADIIKTSGKLTVKVTFTNGCVNTKVVDINCNPTIDGVADPSVFSRANCPEPGSNPKIVVTPSGFGENVVYSLNGGAFQTSNEFLNVTPGTYTITAQETIDGVPYTATDTVVIESSVVPTVSLSPANICQGGTSTLTITGVEGSVFTVKGPTGSIISTVTLGPTGSATVPGLTQAGVYYVQLQGGAPENSCQPFFTSAELTVGGVQLTPTIEVQPGTYCVGEPIPFRILDGGNNATYTLDALGTGLVTSPLQASPFSYNGTFTPNSTSGVIRITGVQGNCNTTTTPQINVTASASPVITSATAICQTNNQHTVTVVATGATGVNIAGLAATSTGPNTWQRTNITGLTSALVIVTNGSCEVEQTVVLQNCLCPTGELYIATDGNTCGQGTTNIYYNGSTLNPDTNWTYVFQDLNFGNWIDINIPVVFNPLSPPNLAANTVINFPKSYRLKLINTTNGCEYVSGQVTVTGVQPPVGVTIFPSIGGSIPTNTPISFSTQQGYSSYAWSGDVTGTTYQSNTVTFTTPGFKQVDVQVCSAVGCCVTATYTFEVVTSCSPAITLGAPSYTPCTDITIVATGGVGAKTYTVSGTYINVSSTPVPITNTIVIPTSSLTPGQSDVLTLTVIDANGVPCQAQTVINYTKVECTGANIIYFVDNSSSMDSSEFANISNHIISSSQAIYDRSNDCTFSLVHYGTSGPSSTTALISTQVNGQTTPITTVTRVYNGNDYLQDSLALLSAAIGGLTLDPMLPTKIFIYTDANGGATSEIGDYEINFSNPNDNNSADNTLGINFMTYTESDALKATYDIIVVGYPSGLPQTQQNTTNVALANVASSGQFYQAAFGQNPTENVLNSLDCSCN